MWPATTPLAAIETNIFFMLGVETMLFQRKIDRAFKIRNMNMESKKYIDGYQLEKGDIPAMLLAAIMVFAPALILLFLVLVGIPMLFFLR